MTWGDDGFWAKKRIILGNSSNGSASAANLIVSPLRDEVQNGLTMRKPLDRRLRQHLNYPLVNAQQP